jgi:SAM-dependent methyltransferase
MKNKILLPGLDKQLQFLVNNFSEKIDSALVVGSASEKLAEQIAEKFSSSAELVVEDFDSLITSKLQLENGSKVKVSIMDYDKMDFGASSFDLVYAQASVSLIKRNKITKEILRILKTRGLFCVGEVVVFTKDYPPFVKNVFDASNLLPLNVAEIENYYSSRGFKILDRLNLSSTLKDYYVNSLNLLHKMKGGFSEQEKSYYKKLINRVNHESNVYLKLGGHKYIGFVVLLLQKDQQ